MKTKAGILIVLAATMLIATGCGIPFDIETPAKTITLPNTAGIYVDRVVDLPEEARRSGITFETVNLSYLVKKENGFVAKVRLYASPDQVEHELKPSNAMLLLEEELAMTDISKSGTVETPIIRDVLNSKQESFVIGAENNSSSPFSAISIEITFRLRGKFGLF